ncbi:MAG: hypothetical protein ACI88A_002589 [Paraglaciecola sp.]|jgi:hypothetical protein
MSILYYRFRNKIIKNPLYLITNIASILLVSACLIAASSRIAAAFESLDYLYLIQGTKTLGGMHNRQPNSAPATYSNQLNAITGTWPALYSADFQFEEDEIANRQTMIDQVKQEYANGAMINLMWHACNPAKEQPCGWDNRGVLGSLSDEEWNDLLTNGTAINNKWKKMMDEVAVYLQQLEDEGIEVMWRPLHEMNHANFWWNGRPGVDGTPELYRMTHDYFSHEKGLTNLIWVWNLQDYATLATDLDDYDPGSPYWDVLTLDMYSTDGTGYTTAKYDAMINKANGKPIGIGECFVIPSLDELAAQPLWTHFMPWSEYTFTQNSDSELQTVYTDEQVLALNEMPGWSGGETNLVLDPLNDFSLIYKHSSKLSFDTSNSQYFDDDNSRLIRTKDTSQYIIYKTDSNISDFAISTHFWRTEQAGDFIIQLSNNGTNFRTYNSTINNEGIGSGNWETVTYTGTNINRSVSYIKIMFPLNESGERAWHPQLGNAEINNSN